METVLDPAKVILHEIAELEVERARTEAKIAERMLAFQDRGRCRSGWRRRAGSAICCR